jgi:hypothetical protein
MLFRTTAARSIPRALSNVTTTNSRSLLNNNAFRAPLNTLARPTRASARLSLVPRKPLATSLVRYQHNVTGITGGKAVEEAYAKEKLPVTPQTVSASSSVHGVRPGAGAENEEHDVDMMAGIKSDFVCPIGHHPRPIEALGSAKS